MSKIAKLLNPNTKQYWENIYKKDTDQKKIRSDGDNLLKFMDQLWAKTAPGGVMMISVPVKGIRDRHPQHVNKFTVKSMFKFMSAYGEIVHIAPRTYSRRSGILATAYFYVEKA